MADYYLGQTLKYDPSEDHLWGDRDDDYDLLCEAPKGTKVYTPSGKVVERGLSGTYTYYGSADGNHSYERGTYVVVGLADSQIQRLAKELWGIRNAALTHSPWQQSEDYATADHKAVYEALARFLIDRYGA